MDKNRIEKLKISKMLSNNSVNSTHYGELKDAVENASDTEVPKKFNKF